MTGCKCVGYGEGMSTANATAPRRINAITDTCDICDAVARMHKVGGHSVCADCAADLRDAIGVEAR